MGKVGIAIGVIAALGAVGTAILLSNGTKKVKHPPDADGGAISFEVHAFNSFTDMAGWRYTITPADRVLKQVQRKITGEKRLFYYAGNPPAPGFKANQSPMPQGGTFVFLTAVTTRQMGSGWTPTTLSSFPSVYASAEATLRAQQVNTGGKFTTFF